MSTKSLKRLTSKAKHSMSGINSLWDGGSHPEKENDMPDLEEFGSTRTYASSTYSDAQPLSPAKDSPSRRKRLMGSLRGMSSLRSLRSSPQKEKGKERTEHFRSPESPCTPMRDVTSLALNFKESPPDQPMFGALQRKCSISSSLVVQHSSPVSIPTSSMRDNAPYSMAAWHYDLPAGTIPDSPGPLQKALERDIKLSPVEIEPSPVHPQTEGAAELLPTPMPGMNTGFNYEDLNGSSPLIHERAALSKVSSDALDYFDIPIAASSAHTELSSVDHTAARRDTPALWKHLGSTTPDRDASATIGLSEVNTADLYGEQAKRCDSVVAAQDPPCTFWNKPVNSKESEPAENFRLHDDKKGPAEEVSLSPMNIEHVVFEESPKLSTVKHQSAHQTHLIRQAEAQLDLQMQAQRVTPTNKLTAREIQASTAEVIDPVLAPNTWGTHGSLYDGSGYGESPNSISIRPSTPSKVFDKVKESTEDNKYTAESLAQDSVAMARDHEALEEVIRAYAALEEKATSSANEDAWEDIVTNDCASDELVESLAGHNLAA